MFNLRVYLAHHRYALLRSWQQWHNAPGATFLTIAVLSIALLLPTTLLVLLSNTQNLVKRWDTGTGITLYLQPTVSSQVAKSLTQTLAKQSTVASAVYISPEQGAKEFVDVSGLSNAFSALDSNPLPGVIEVKPVNTDSVALQKLQTQLQILPQVAVVKLDMQWVKRLFAIVGLTQQLVYGLLIILALAALLIVGNTIRMTVQNDKDEIQVLKLVGASASFIRRPFLYGGILYGLVAGGITAVFTNVFIIFLGRSVEKLALLYNSQFYLKGLTLSEIFVLLLFSVILGFIGSWLALSRHLLEVEIH